MTKLEAVAGGQAAQATAKKKAEGRSPSYPGIDLAQALDKARVVFQHESRNSAPVSAILTHWGFKATSGPGTVALAALKKFGLMEDQGNGPNRTAKLTDLAFRILLDEREESPERAAAIREAALKPGIHADLWTKYAGDIPSDATLRHHLRVDRKFTGSGADEFIRQFRSTIDFAKLKEAGSISPERGEMDDDPDEEEPKDEAKPKGRKPMVGVREEAFTLDEGQATLTWPENISIESAADLEAWLQLIIKKAKRLAEKTERELGYEPEDPND